MKMMIKTNDQEIQKIIDNNEDLILVFGKGANCGVCHAVEDRINKTFKDKYPNLKIYQLEVDDSPEFRGQHLIFAVPTILVFDRTKEIHRESRIVDFNKLHRLLDLYYS